jgi:large subunit ribosomal protein L23
MGIFSKKTKIDDKKAAVSPAPIKTEKAKETVSKTSMKDLYGGASTSSVASGKSTKKDKIIRKYGSAYSVLVKPLITEKASNIGVLNKYMFMVSSRANKIEVAKAIEEVYGIKPTNVHIMTVFGKKVRYGRIMGERKDWKKAIITLPVGKTINIYEGV